METMEPLDLRTALRTTGSVRAFTDEPVPLDVVARVLDTCSVYEQMNNSERLKPSYIQKEKVEKGELGKKSGKGYYNYTPIP